MFTEALCKNCGCCVKVQREYVIQSKSFTATEFNKTFSDSQLRQVVDASPRKFY